MWESQPPAQQPEGGVRMTPLPILQDSQPTQPGQPSFNPPGLSFALQLPRLASGLPLGPPRVRSCCQFCLQNPGEGSQVTLQSKLALFHPGCWPSRPPRQSKVLGNWRLSQGACHCPIWQRGGSGWFFPAHF